MRKSQARRVTHLLGVAAMVSLLLAACGDDDNRTESGLREVIFLSPVPVQTIGLFAVPLAQELGFFEDEGLEVDFVTSDGSGFVVQQMLAGRADAGWVIAGSAVNAFAQGQPLQAVQDLPVEPGFSLAVPSDSSIESYEDLKGEKIGVDSLSAGEIPEIKGDLGALGLESDKDYQIIPLGDDVVGAFELLRQGEAAALSIAYNDLPNMQAAGLDFRVLSPPEGGDAHRPVLPMVVTKKIFEEEPEVVVGLGRAVNKAMYFAAENPEATLAIMKEKFPEEHEDADFARAMLEATMDLFYPDSSVDLTTYRFGEMSIDGWQELVDFFAAAPAPDAPPMEDFEIEDFVTNDLIEEMNDFDRDAVAKLAQDSDLTYP